MNINSQLIFNFQEVNWWRIQLLIVQMTKYIDKSIHKCSKWASRKLVTIILPPAGRQRKRHNFSDEAVVFEGRRRSDADAHRVVERRRSVLSSNFRESAVDGQRHDVLSIVEILAVVQLDGIAVNRVVEHVDLQEAYCDLLPRLLAAYQLTNNRRMWVGGNQPVCLVSPYW